MLPRAEWQTEGEGGSGQLIQEKFFVFDEYGFRVNQNKKVML